MRRRHVWNAMMATVMMVAMAAPSAQAGDDSDVCQDANGVPYVSFSDNDGDGTVDCKDPDDDNDRISDRVERALGYDQYSEDQDMDRIPDTYDLQPGFVGIVSEISIEVHHIANYDNCGDGDAWDPYFTHLMVNLPGESVAYDITRWSKSNHPDNYEGSDLDLPEARTQVSSDARDWNLLETPRPWSQSLAAMMDDDAFNEDDEVRLDGELYSVEDDKLDLLTGTVGMAKSGIGGCSGSISFRTAQGFADTAVKIAQKIIRDGVPLVECHHLGMPADCGGPEPTATGPGVPTVPTVPTPDPPDIDAPEVPSPDTDGLADALAAAVAEALERSPDPPDVGTEVIMEVVTLVVNAIPEPPSVDPDEVARIVAELLPDLSDIPEPDLTEVRETVDGLLDGSPHTPDPAVAELLVELIMGLIPELDPGDGDDGGEDDDVEIGIDDVALSEPTEDVGRSTDDALNVTSTDGTLWVVVFLDETSEAATIAFEADTDHALSEFTLEPGTGIVAGALARGDAMLFFGGDAGAVLALPRADSADPGGSVNVVLKSTDGHVEIVRQVFLPAEVL